MQQPQQILLFSLLFFLGHAQDLVDTIVGCEEVGCPLEGSVPHCTLTGIEFRTVGLTRIPDVPQSLDTFSIVKAVNISGIEGFNWTSIYYLGTPENVSLDQVHGCAVIFHEPPQNKFTENGTHTCSEVMNQQCIDAIQDRGSKVAEAGSDDVCNTLKLSLEEDEIEECKDLTGNGKGIGSISVTSLSSLENINGSRNSTSDCWPITPKSANLAEMFKEVKDLGHLNLSTAAQEEDRITPLLTVFMKAMGEESIVEETVSRLSCIQVNYTLTAAEEYTAAASLPAMSALTVGCALALFIWML